MRDLFAGTGLEFEFAREIVVLRFDSIEHAVELYEDKFGPVISARQQLEPEGRWAAVRDELATLFHAHNQSTDGTLAYPGEYLVSIARNTEQS